MSLKSLLLTVCLFICARPALPGVGGVGGGSAANYITVQVCEGETGEQCRMVRIKNRFTDQDHLNALNQKGECLISVGEAQMVPCNDNMKTGIPKWLKKLNEAFGPAGAENAPNDLHNY